MNFEKILQSLGIHITRWKWRWIRLKQSLQSGVRRAEVAKSHTVYKHKLCNNCGTLMDQSEKFCPHCQTKAPSWSGQVLQRFFGIMLPSRAFVTYFILLINLAVAQAGIILFGFQNLFSPDNYSLVRLGAYVPFLFESGEYWRIITSGYLHIGIAHILFNMIALMQVGPFLEKEIGSARFWTVYALSLIGSVFFDFYLRSEPVIISAGASGAIFGLIGFGVTYAHFLGGPVGKRVRNFFLQWALYAFVFGFFVRANNYAHLGGFLSGAILGFLIERERLHKQSLNLLWNVLATLCLIITILSFGGMIFNFNVLAWTH